MKKIFIVCFVYFLFIASAHAAMIELNDIAELPGYTETDWTANYGTFTVGNQYSGNVGMQKGIAFVHTYEFSLLDLLGINVSVDDAYLSFAPDVLNISGLIGELWNGSTLVTSGTNFVVSNLVAGNYALKVSGTADGSSGGLYSLDVSLTKAAVPVPAAVWMLGTGLVALLGMRRKMTA